MPTDTLSDPIGLCSLSLCLADTEHPDNIQALAYNSADYEHCHSEYITPRADNSHHVVDTTRRSSLDPLI